MAFCLLVVLVQPLPVVVVAIFELSWRPLLTVVGLILLVVADLRVVPILAGVILKVVALLVLPILKSWLCCYSQSWLSFFVRSELCCYSQQWLLFLESVASMILQIMVFVFLVFLEHVA